MKKVAVRCVKLLRNVTELMENWIRGEYSAAPHVRWRVLITPLAREHL